jgi:hypothetical protein
MPTSTWMPATRTGSSQRTDPAAAAAVAAAAATAPAAAKRAGKQAAKPTAPGRAGGKAAPGAAAAIAAAAAANPSPARQHHHHLSRILQPGQGGCGGSGLGLAAAPRGTCNVVGWATTDRLTWWWLVACVHLARLPVRRPSAHAPAPPPPRPCCWHCTCMAVCQAGGILRGKLAWKRGVGTSRHPRGAGARRGGCGACTRRQRAGRRGSRAPPPRPQPPLAHFGAQHGVITTSNRPRGALPAQPPSAPPPRARANLVADQVIEWAAHP